MVNHNLFRKGLDINDIYKDVNKNVEIMKEYETKYMAELHTYKEKYFVDETIKELPAWAKNLYAYNLLEREINYRYVKSVIETITENSRYNFVFNADHNKRETKEIKFEKPPLYNEIDDIDE